MSAAIFIALVLALAVAACLWPPGFGRKRKSPARPYDWEEDGECGPQSHHVRVLKPDA